MHRSYPSLWLFLLLTVGLFGCDTTFVERNVRVRIDPTGEDFWDLPFPSDLRQREDGSYGLSAWPNAKSNDYVTMWLETADERLRNGWGLSTGTFAPLTGEIDPTTLPSTPTMSTGHNASAFIINVDPNSENRGRRIPVDVSFLTDTDELSPEHYLAAIPVFGFVREPTTIYALVVTDLIRDLDGERLGRSTAFHDAFEDNRNAHDELREQLGLLKETLARESYDLGRVVGASIFTTMDPDAELLKLAQWTETQPTPTLTSPWEVTEDYESYSVVVGTYKVPVIQLDTRPYANSGDGQIAYDLDGQPLIEDTQEIHLALTIPKMPQPESGFPLTIYMHGSGGNWYQAITRGPVEEVPEDEQTSTEPGTGPAEWLARRGVATIGFDFPLHGTRYTPSDTSGLMLYNLFGNIHGTIDNFQVSVMELLLLSRFVLETQVDADLGPHLDAGGAPDDVIRFDPARLTAMGHSMGATLGVPWAGVDPRVRGVVFSGAGGMLVEIANTALEPVDVKATLETLIFRGHELVHHAHPLIHAFQNLWDLVDPVIKGSRVTLNPHPEMPPKDILMSAGFRDGYFHPRSQSALALTLGIPLAGNTAEPILAERLAVAGRSPVDYPISSNLNGKTAAVISYDAPHQLGHYVLFNQSSARHQYTCFLATVGTQVGATIFAPGTIDSPCQ